MANVGDDTRPASWPKSDRQLHARKPPFHIHARFAFAVLIAVFFNSAWHRNAGWVVIPNEAAI
jgi:hypothetical protein